MIRRRMTRWRITTRMDDSKIFCCGEVMIMIWRRKEKEEEDKDDNRDR